ncbi:MAG: biotin transporter BioY [Gemmatimonadota bacterium]|jgi:biotin transport system substrate-specific component
MMQGTGTLREWAVREVATDRKVRMALGILIFVLATSFGAYVAVPLPGTAVPITLQPLFIILAGAVLGPWGGAGAMASYLALGVSGAPVFSFGGAGLPWLLGPTGGYLIAAPAAAFLVGYVARGGAGRIRRGVALSLGIGTLYVGGVAQLLLLTGAPLATTVAMGVLPFLIGDLIKVFLALVLLERFPSTSLGGV